MLQRALQNGITSTPPFELVSFVPVPFIHPWKTMTLKLDTYTIYARIFRDPFIGAADRLWFFVTREAEWNNLLKFIISLRFLGSVSISACFSIFMLIHQDYVKTF